MTAATQMTGVCHLPACQHPTDKAVVTANETLSTLTAEIKSQNGPSYSFIEIDPINNQNGGEPGGNIRNAYLYDASVIQLRNPNPGGSKDAIDITPDGELTYNPGLIDPTNEAWEHSRKPLVAAWETVGGEGSFVTINVHLTSKGGSTSLEGDPRPPVNGGVEKRLSQTSVIGVRPPSPLLGVVLWLTWMGDRTSPAHC